MKSCAKIIVEGMLVGLLITFESFCVAGESPFVAGTELQIDEQVQLYNVQYSSRKYWYAMLCTVSLSKDVSDISLTNHHWIASPYYSDGYKYYGCRIGSCAGNTRLKHLQVVNRQPDQSYDSDYCYTNMVDSAFAGCSALQRIELPAEIKTIPVSCFSGCKALESCVGSFTNIEDCAFENCSLLDAQGINFMEGVERIGRLAFCGCETLSAAVLGAHLQVVGDKAFMGATNLQSVAAYGRPPTGLVASELMLNYPTVRYPAEYESEWQDALAACSSNLVVQIADGTNMIYTAGSSKTIIMSCDVDQASIYYTLDGTDPTTNSTKYTTKFKVKPQGKMTIKASAIIDRWPYHSVQSITLAPGKCVTPTASMADEEVFYGVYLGMRQELGGYFRVLSPPDAA